MRSRCRARSCRRRRAPGSGRPARPAGSGAWPPAGLEAARRGRAACVISTGPSSVWTVLAVDAVAVVAGPAGRRLAGRIAQVLGQLGAQRGLDHPARELRQQPARAGDLLRAQGPSARPRARRPATGRRAGRQRSAGAPAADSLPGGAVAVDSVFCVVIGVLSRPARRAPLPASPSGLGDSRTAASGRVGHPDLTQNIGQTPVERVAKRARSVHGLRAATARLRPGAFLP